jgi:hypothetical protein
MAHTPPGRLNDQQWGWIICAAIFAWIRTRYQQAVAEGLAQEQHVTRMDPSPCDSAIVLSILPMLADQSPIDWSKPLTEWSREEMADFVGLASCLIDEAKAALEQVPDAILHKPAGISLMHPFLKTRFERCAGSSRALCVSAACLR